MILEVSEHSSTFTRAIAATILAVHIGSGVVGLSTGVVALCLRKGSRGHRIAGDIFFVAMLFACGIGAAVGPFLSTPLWNNLLAGLLGCYLLATSWRTAHFHQIGSGVFDFAAPVIGLSIAVLATFLTLRGMVRSDGFIVAILALLAAVGDVKVVVNRGISGAARLWRHLWRMLFPLFLAAGAFFLGQRQLMPQFLRGSPALFLPQFVIVIALVFWLARLTLKGRTIEAAMPSSLSNQ